MKKTIVGSMLLSAFLILSACSHKKDEKKKQSSPETASLSSEVTPESLERVTKQWPQSSQTAIKELTTKYGLPAAVTEEMVVWNEAGPFKRSVVYKEEVNHMFPIQHFDILQQTVDYRVPQDKVASLARFDGSLIIDRTKGELSARNHREEMNILALNLADKIVRGEMTVEDARREYGSNAEALMAGTTNPMLTSLNFETTGQTADPDSMMQSQQGKESQQDPSAKKQEQAEEVDVIIIDQSRPAEPSDSPEAQEQQESMDSMESEPVE